MLTRRIVSALTMTAATVAAAVTPAMSGGIRGDAHSPALNGGPPQIPHVAAQAEAAIGKALAGTWVVNVHQPPFPPSQRHFTFTSDGALVTNDDLQVGPNFVEHFTIAQGNWVSTGNGMVSATLVGQRYNLQGALLGTYKVRMNLELSQAADQWTATFRINILLPDGQVIFTSDGTFAATRLEVEPL
jgi:hypothetical protein